MTQTTPRQSPPRDRLPRTNPAREERAKEIRLGVLGVLGIAILLIGVPVALALFVGYPLPRSAPSRQWLTQDVTATLIIKILACVVWLLWAHFAVCVIAEWRALRRGRLPGDVPFGGGSQMLARRLVASALLLAGAATAFGHSGLGGSDSAPAPNRTVASASQHAGQAVGRAAQTPAQSVAGVATTTDDAAGTRDAARENAGTTKTYTVQVPDGRNYDCLWDIAQRTLGDPMRYKEIFALNKDRIQADGRKLVDADLIRPGWQLRLPADANGPGVHTVHARTATPAAPAADTSATAASAHTDLTAPASSSPSATAASAVGRSVGATTVHAGPAGARAAAAGTRASTSHDPSWNADLLGGGLMLAGIALALSARRGPYSAADDDEQAITAAADTALASSLDRALRNLAAARRDQGLELPQPVLAWVDADEVVLALAGGDTDRPPAPWRAEADATWRCALADLHDHPALAEVAAPFPGLLSVGRDGAHDVFVDFEQAPGLVSVGGDTERARDLVTAIAAQAVTCAWSDGAKATLVGFGDGDELAALDTHRVTHARALGEVLDDLEREHGVLSRLRHGLGLDGVLNGRLSRRSAAWTPHVIVLSGPPGAEESRRLAQLVGTGRSQFVVLVVGDLLHAAWRFVVDDQGELDLGVLGATVRAHQLDRNAMLQLIDTLRAAAQRATQGAATVAGLAPRAALTDVEVEPPDGGDSSLPVRRDRPATGQATVAVSLLGPVRVDAPGPLDASRRELATEIVVAVALAPAGVPEAVLRSQIWPRGVGDDVVAAAMSDVVDWLGSDAAGRPALRQVDGRWVLGEGVWIDWENLLVAVDASQGAAELEALMFCVSLFRGEAFSDTPAGRYGWLSFRRCARDAAVLATTVVRRAAELLVRDGRVDDAEDALRRGLVLIPTAEPIWRDLLTLSGRRGPDAAAAVAAQMYGVLASHRAWAQPETDALVRQLAPGRVVTDTA